jgi:Uma2 family endonuclease
MRYPMTVDLQPHPVVEAPEESGSVLPLESGDRLPRPEFERRYESMPELKKAELIDGVVYVGSPVRAVHSGPHARIMTWLGVYYAATPGVDVHDNATVRLDLDNEPQPDALLRIDPAVGGRSRITSDDYLEGPPELVVEIAASSAAYDLHDKLRVYRRNGVQEYLVWQIYERRIDWWELRDGVYVPLGTDEAGVVRSRVFPGLWLATGAMIAGDLAGVLAVVQQGIGTEDHSSFVARLHDEEHRAREQASRRAGEQASRAQDPMKR